MAKAKATSTTKSTRAKSDAGRRLKQAQQAAIRLKQALDRFRPRAPCPSPQTCPTTLAPPARRGYDPRARRARLISYPL
jgi:hypothetical protein